MKKFAEIWPHKIFLALFFGLLFLAQACGLNQNVDGQKHFYDIDNGSVKNQEKIFTYFRQITGYFQTKTLVLNGIQTESFKTTDRVNLSYPPLLLVDKPPEAQGHGVILNNFVLTAAHVADNEGFKNYLLDVVYKYLGLLEPPDAQNVLYDFVILQDRILQNNRNYSLQVLAWDAANEMGLLVDSYDPHPAKLSASLFPPVILGDSTKLAAGDSVYIVTLNNIKEAKIGSPEQIADNWKPQGLFVVATESADIIENGDSGAPVFALRNGLPELVGLLVAMKSDNANLGVVVNSSVIKEFIKPYLINKPGNNYLPWLPILSPPPP